MWSRVWPESANAPCPRALTCGKTMASKLEKPKVGFYNFVQPSSSTSITKIIKPMQESNEFFCPIMRHLSKFSKNISRSFTQAKKFPIEFGKDLRFMKVLRKREWILHLSLKCVWDLTPIKVGVNSLWLLMYCILGRACSTQAPRGCNEPGRVNHGSVKKWWYAVLGQTCPKLQLVFSPLLLHLVICVLSRRYMLWISHQDQLQNRCMNSLPLH